MKALSRPRAAATAIRLPSPAVVWAFSRPHTLIVTSMSIVGIYLIAASVLPSATPGDGLGDLALTLLAGILVNVYIVGLNQCEDVEIDRVNKPWLPIAAGRLSLPTARVIVAVCGMIALGMAISQGWVETLAVGSAIAIGTAYSSPPFRLKRYPALAAASISLVRAIAVNVGVYLHFAASLEDRPGISALPDSVVALTLFVLPFAFAIAVLKDVPDVEGDRRYSIGTFTVRFGPQRAFAMGMAALTAGYLAMALVAPMLVDDASAPVLVGGHLAALAVLWRLSAAVDPHNSAAFSRFYLRVWALFFAEYLLVPTAVLAA